jgi:hypothetical protein
MIVDSFDADLSTAVFSSACEGIVVNTIGTAFVDDSSLSITSTYSRINTLTTIQNDSDDNNTNI